MAAAELFTIEIMYGNKQNVFSRHHHVGRRRF